MPYYKHKEEFILWLAGFIEKMIEGEEKFLHHSHRDILQDFIFQSDPNSFLDIRNIHSGERIISYFRNDDSADKINGI
ncbi:MULTISPECIES: hypothetical protein [Acinetobacter]|jgi:hypothetical protein|uniref:hypothetical protein n=1 Tax=Acinetobacter TaxID=469 RepID=UPI00019AE0DF|nr:MULTISPECIES: hypothetical protein [Acinetobacter]EEH69621.1 hypothetical protein HMPREF0023_0862 [Acinetobacter sp. ATCC 27244]